MNDPTKPSVTEHIIWYGDSSTEAEPEEIKAAKEFVGESVVIEGIIDLAGWMVTGMRIEHGRVISGKLVITRDRKGDEGGELRSGERGE